MPNFKKNTSPAMKRSGFKMNGYTYPGKSPLEYEKDPKDFEKRKKKEDIENPKPENKQNKGLTEEQKKGILTAVKEFGERMADQEAVEQTSWEDMKKKFS